MMARARRLLIAGGGDNCIRMLPALIMTVQEASEVLERFETVCQDARAQLQSKVG